MPPPVEIRANSREKKKSRCTEMCNPANKEVEDPSPIDVFRSKGNIADEIPNVIQRHEDHRKSANEVDGADPSITTLECQAINRRRINCHRCLQTRLSQDKRAGKELKRGMNRVGIGALRQTGAPCSTPKLYGGHDVRLLQRAN